MSTKGSLFDTSSKNKLLKTFLKNEKENKRGCGWNRKEEPKVPMLRNPS